MCRRSATKIHWVDEEHLKEEWEIVSKFLHLAPPTLTSLVSCVTGDLFIRSVSGCDLIRDVESLIDSQSLGSEEIQAQAQIFRGNLFQLIEWLIHTVSRGWPPKLISAQAQRTLTFCHSYNLGFLNSYSCMSAVGTSSAIKIIWLWLWVSDSLFHCDMIVFLHYSLETPYGPVCISISFYISPRCAAL